MCLHFFVHLLCVQVGRVNAGLNVLPISEENLAEEIRNSDLFANESGFAWPAEGTTCSSLDGPFCSFQEKSAGSSNVRRLLAGTAASLFGWENGWAALRHIAIFGYKDLAVTLMDNHHLVNQKDKHNGWTALDYAANSGHVEVLHILLDDAGFTQVNNRDDELMTVLHRAVLAGHLAATRTLLEHTRFEEPDAKDKRGCTALHLAASEGHVNLAKFLIEHGRLPDEAVNAKDGANSTALHHAVKSGHLAIAELVLGSMRFKEADASNIFGTALHLAAFAGHVQLAKFLVGHGEFGKVNAKESHGYTALHAAVTNGHGEVVSFLVADSRFKAINAKDDDGWTALDRAMALQRTEISEVLAQLNAERLAIETHSARNPFVDRSKVFDTPSNPFMI